MDDRASSCWSSLKSKILLSTMRTTTMRGGDDEPHLSRWSPGGNDIEMGHEPGPVVFNNRLDVPSLRSSSDNRSCSSKDDGGSPHRGLSPPDSAFGAQLGDRSSASSEVGAASGRGSDEAPRRDGAVGQ